MRFTKRLKAIIIKDVVRTTYGALFDALEGRATEYARALYDRHSEGTGEGRRELINRITSLLPKEDHRHVVRLKSIPWNITPKGKTRSHNSLHAWVHVGYSDHAQVAKLTYDSPQIPVLIKDTGVSFYANGDDTSEELEREWVALEEKADALALSVLAVLDTAKSLKRLEELSPELYPFAAKHADEADVEPTKALVDAGTLDRIRNALTGGAK